MAIGLRAEPICGVGVDDDFGSAGSSSGEITKPYSEKLERVGERAACAGGAHAERKGETGGCSVVERSLEPAAGGEAQLIEHPGFAVVLEEPESAANRALSEPAGAPRVTGRYVGVLYQETHRVLFGQRSQAERQQARA